MRKIQFAFGLALSALLFSMTPTASAQTLTLTDTQAVADAIVTTYDPSDGSMSVAGNGQILSSYSLISATNAFTDALNGVWDGPFDVVTATKLFTLQTGGVESLDMGMSLPPGMTGEALIADLENTGSLKPSGTFDSAPGGGPYLYVVPEPSSILLSVFGLLGLIGMRRRQA